LGTQNSKLGIDYFKTTPITTNSSVLCRIDLFRNITTVLTCSFENTCTAQTQLQRALTSNDVFAGKIDVIRTVSLWVTSRPDIK